MIEAVSPTFPLGAIVEDTAEGAAYLSGEHAVVKVRHANSPGADDLLRRWQAIAQLSHPHLAQIFEAGRCELGGEPCIYAAMEHAEETLAGVLSDRPLSPDETLEMLQPAIDALQYIHQNGYVHGNLEPGSILALGDSLKLSSESLRPEGEAPEGRAEDVRALGLTALEALMQKTDEAEAEKLPQPFADIVRNTVTEIVGERWTLAQVSARLRAPSLPPLPPRVEKPVAAMEEQIPRGERSSIPKWPLAAGAVALLGIGGFFLARKPAPPPVAAAAVVVAPGTQAAPQARGTKPAAVPGQPRDAGSWCVVVATYHGRSAAEKRALSTSKKWPRFKARVFETAGGTQHLVVIGTGLSQSAAESLRKKARAAGLPRDVFIAKIPG